MFDDIGVGLVIIVVAVVIVSIVAYSFLKKKKDYKSNGVPEQVVNPRETEGSSDAKSDAETKE